MINSIQEQIKELAHISLEFMFGENVASPELEDAVYDAIEDKVYRDKTYCISVKNAQFVLLVRRIQPELEELIGENDMVMIYPSLDKPYFFKGNELLND